MSAPRTRPVLKAFTVILIAITTFVVWLILTTPNVAKIERCMRTSMYKVWLCPKNPNYVPLSQISPIFRSVVIASEDANFYWHHGFDWSQIHESFDKDLETHRIVRGGSTITQQLAKNVFLTKDRTILRKLREAYLTVQIEALLTKNKILEKYLNIIELGPGVYGVKAAARYYFNKSPAELDVLDSAYLAYLIPNPRVYSRTFERKKLTTFAKFRIRELCYIMFRTGKISEAEYTLAINSLDSFPWQNVAAPPSNPELAPNSALAPAAANAATAPLNNQPTVELGGGQVGEHNP